MRTRSPFSTLRRLTLSLYLVFGGLWGGCNEKTKPTPAMKEKIAEAEKGTSSPWLTSA